MTTVLITGGAGFLGRGLIHRLTTNPYIHERVKARVDKIVVYSRGAEKHYAINQKWPSVQTVVGDVLDTDRLRDVMSGVNIVIHAAAFKYVPEGEVQPSIVVEQNIMGSMSVIEAAEASGVQRVVGISTDKACEPVNMYGITKLAMERLFVEANEHMASDIPIFNSVRYGNVIASTGSAIPIFRHAIQTSRIIKLTDGSMTRFWLTIQDAVDLVMEAIALDADYGGSVLIPYAPASTMGRVVEACCQVEGVELCGLPAYMSNIGREPAFSVCDECGYIPSDTRGPVHIQVTGLRFGEKQHESLLGYAEMPFSLSYDSMPDYFFLMPQTCGQIEESNQARAYTRGYTSDAPHQMLMTGEMAELIRRADSEERELYS